MDKEQAKELLPIIQAFSEGKTIESRYIKGDTSLWYDDNNPDFDEDFEYRIKPESKYRPFASAKECFEEMQKHKPYGWVKDASKMYNITIIRDDGIIVNTSIDGGLYNFESSLNLKFADGTPFGIIED